MSFLPGWVFVTAVYDIRRGAYVRTLWDNVLLLAAACPPNVCMYVWCDHGSCPVGMLELLGSNVHVLYAALEEFPTFAAGIAPGIQLPALRNVDKDTPEFLALMNTKAAMVARVAEADAQARALPALSSYAWIDAGIVKLWDQNVDALRENLETVVCTPVPAATLVATGIWPQMMPHAAHGHPCGAQSVYWRYCGGFFAIAGESVQAICGVLSERYLALLRGGHSTWEVNVWALLEAEMAAASATAPAGASTHPDVTAHVTTTETAVFSEPERHVPNFAFLWIKSDHNASFFSCYSENMMFAAASIPPARIPGRFGLPVYPLAFCIPDECVVVIGDAPLEKIHVIADLLPWNRLTHRFGASDEAAYDAMYTASRFAFTTREGGWDCLRHYEILAAGCIPIFETLHDCPRHTLTTFPKQLVHSSMATFLPWKEEYSAQFNHAVSQLLAHTRKHCTTSATARRILNTFNASLAAPAQRVLMLCCDPGVNYTREFTWIGIARELLATGGQPVCFPELPYLYDDHEDASVAKLFGFGYKYARRLPSSTRLALEEPAIREMIQVHAFDIILFGKVGVDEGKIGTLPHLPLWEEVIAHYAPEQIGFLYGGNACQHIGSNNQHTQHLLKHAAFGRCFVRELST